MLLFTLTANLFIAGLALCVFTAGNAIARTCVVSLSSKESGGQYGTAAGLSYSMDNLGRILGPLFSHGYLLYKQVSVIIFRQR